MNEPTLDALAQRLSHLVKQPFEWVVILMLTILLFGTTWFLGDLVFSQTGRYQLVVSDMAVFRLDTKTGEVEMFGQTGILRHFKKQAELPAAAQ